MSATRLYDPPLWRFVVTDLESATVTTLDQHATQRTVGFVLNGPATASGLVPSDDPQINIPSPNPDSPAFLTNNARLLYGLRREVRQAPEDDPWQARWGGIVMNMEDVAADSPTSRYTAFDPWQYLMSRPVRDPETGEFPGPDGLVYTDARASDIALDLLLTTVTVDGEVFIDFGSDSIIAETDVIPGITKFERGLMVGEAWNQLCDTGTIDIVLVPIYDPVNRPGKVCELQIQPKAGQVRYNAVFAWDKPPRNVSEISRLVDGTRLANRVQMFAGQGGEPVALQSDAASIAEFGEYWAQQFMVGKEDQTALVELLALAQVQIRKKGARSVTFSPAPERSLLSLRDYALGDYVPVWSSKNLREPLGVDYDAFDPAAPGGSGYQRVYEIPISLDDNGTERVNAVRTTPEQATGVAE